MSKVRIVTDSTSCLPEDILHQYGISVVPVGLVIEGKAYRDTFDISLEQFWSKFASIETQPTTSAASPGDFIKVFTDLARTTDNIVCILVSRALSATQESAYQARRIFRPECPRVNIEIIDSKTSVGALGFVVLEAARAAEMGKSMQQVAEIAAELATRCVYLAGLDTLKYLIKSGRAPKGSNLIGEMLQVKPLIGITSDTGLVEVVARVRGKENVITRLVGLVKEYADTTRPLHVMLHYSKDVKEVEELRKLVTARYDCSEIYITPLTPVVVSSAGPMVAIGFYS